MRAPLLCLFVCLHAATLHAQAVAPPSVRQSGSATLQNVPAIPPQVSAAVQRYQNYRSASFEDWLADGSMLIATRFGSSQQIHRVLMPGGDRTQLTFSAEPVARAIAIPKTDRFVMSRDIGGDEWYQLYIAAVSGSPALLTQPGTRNQSVVMASDGQLMAWSQATKGSGDYTIWTARPDDPRSARLVYRGSGAVNPQDVSPDRTKLLITRNISNRESRLLLLDIASGQASEIATGSSPALYQNPRFARDGRSLVVLSDADSDVRRLIEIEIATGKTTILTPNLPWDVENFELTRDGRVLAYAINEDGYSRVVLQDFVTRRALPQPQLPRGTVTSIGFSPDGERLALGLSTATSAGDVWVWDVKGGALTRWTSSEIGEIDRATLIEPELVRFKSFDGLVVPAFVYRPKNVPASARTPVIVDIHGGPESQTRAGWNVGAQYFAQMLGATVILPNVRGSEGYGKRYLNLDNAEKREDSVKDIGALLDWIATQPGLDAKRVAVYGQSYGGYMSLAVMTHYAERLVGGVERYGISDWISFLTNTESYRRDNRRAEYGDERDPKMAAVFRRISPLASVPKISKPMLVMQGANDPRVPKRESDQVVEGIRRNGVEVWYVVFADEGHGFLKKPNNDLRREVETMFLAKLFGGDRLAAE
jgi:dipeptidyl aminopeptidase/acylaminoacyl peptidase